MDKRLKTIKHTSKRIVHLTLSDNTKVWMRYKTTKTRNVANKKKTIGSSLSLIYRITPNQQTNGMGERRECAMAVEYKQFSNAIKKNKTRRQLEREKKRTRSKTKDTLFPK